MICCRPPAADLFFSGCVSKMSLSSKNTLKAYILHSIQRPQSSAFKRNPDSFLFCTHDINPFNILVRTDVLWRCHWPQTLQLLSSQSRFWVCSAASSPPSRSLPFPRITLLDLEERPLIMLGLVLASLWAEAIKSLSGTHRTLCYFLLCWLTPACLTAFSSRCHDQNYTLLESEGSASARSQLFSFSLFFCQRFDFITC